MYKNFEVLSLENRVRVISVAYIIFIAMFLSMIFSPIVISRFVGPTDRVYGYSIDLSRLDITLKFAKIIDRDRVVVVGSIGGTHGVAVVNVSNPYEDPVVEDIYPLTGIPTCIATDGFPLTRVAVGSDKGEILVLKIDRGRITKHIYVVLGADFYVEKIYLARDAYGNVKILTFVRKGGGQGYPCMNCYIYILDEDVQGILRIGPRVGNATWWGRVFENMHVQDVVPLVVYDRNGYYYDASNVLIPYIPQVLKLVLNVTYINATTGEAKPLPGALVEVTLMPKGSPTEIIVYGVNADSRGVARIPVPIDRQRTLVINITVRALNGLPVWMYSVELDPKRVEQILQVSDEIPLPTALLSTDAVDRRPAEKVYGIPPFLYMKLDLYDFSTAPQFYRLKGSATFTLLPSVRDIKFIKGAAEPRAKLLYIDPAKGFIGLFVVAVGAGISRTTFTEDYVGEGVSLVDSATYNDGSYVLAGLNDGRIRVYVAEGQSYRLRYIYPLGSSIINIVSIPTLEGYVYVAVASSGIQVFRVDPYPLPVYRALTQLYASTYNYIYGDALPDLSSMILVSTKNMILVRNSDIAVNRRLIVPLDTVLAKDITLNINMPGNEDINGTEIVFRYPNGAVTYVLSKSSRVVLRNIVPDLVYSVDVKPAKPYIYPITVTFRLTNQTLQILGVSRSSTSIATGNYSISINLEYKEYTVRISIADEITGSKLVAPIDIYIDGKVVASATTATHFNVTLIYGEHNITVTPSKGYEDAYQTVKRSIHISNNVDIAITLERKRYSVKIKVLDDLTKSAPIALVRVEFADTYFLADPSRYEFNLTFPYGVHSVRLRPAELFENVYIPKEYTLSIPQQLTYVLTLSRNKFEVNLILKDLYSINLVAPVDIYVNGTLYIVNTTKPSVSLEIPYGVWSIRVSPSKGFENVYIDHEVLLNVNSSMSYEVTIPRALYTVSINVVDIYGKLISPITISINGPVKIEQKIEPPGKMYYFTLPYGLYNIVITPFNKSIYVPYNTSIIIDSPKSITLPIQRVKYRLGLSIYDRYILIGRFELRINGTKVADNVGAWAQVELPYGVYVVQLVPLPQFEVVYQPSRPLTVVLTSNTNISIAVDRKLYTFRLTVMEGTTPVGNAMIDIVAEGTNIFITSLPTDPTLGYVETRLPYGLYRVIVRHPQYKDKETIIDITKDTTYVLQVEPTIPTLIMRFTPIIGTLIGVGAAVYVIMKVRAILAKRILEEEIF
jgi:hypothetical protein